jgi:hypothetical protein
MQAVPQMDPACIIFTLFDDKRYMFCRVTSKLSDGLWHPLTDICNKKSVHRNAFLRKKRDSNPRTREGQRFSRPPHSTTLPSFL